MYRRRLNPLMGSGNNMSRDLMSTYRPQRVQYTYVFVSRGIRIDDNFLGRHQLN
jgi:hypothetical protein